MYFPTTRVLTVLALLQSHTQISGRELAQRLEVDARTVRRYITMLQDLGIPVESIRGRYGSYRLLPGFKLPPLMFTDEEALALTLGLLAARKMGVTLTAPGIEGAIAKIERVLPVELKERVQVIEETLVFDFARSGVQPDHGVVKLLSAAAGQRRRVQMRYRAYEKEETERPVDPYGLVYRSGFWYMVGYCHLRRDMRSFRLDRIVDVSICTETFTRPDTFDCLEFVVRGIPQTPGEWYVEVLLETTLVDAQRVVPSAFALLDPHPEGVLLRSYVNHLATMAHLLARLHCSFVVRQPDELRMELRQLAEHLTQMSKRQEK